MLVISTAVDIQNTTERADVMLETKTVDRESSVVIYSKLPVRRLLSKFFEPYQYL